MRMLLRFTMPVETGNEAIKAGTITTMLQDVLGELKPEAAYFTAQSGRRGGFIVFDLQDPSQIPAVAEPFFLAFNAEVELTPVMTAADLQKAGSGIEQAVKKYGQR